MAGKCFVPGCQFGLDSIRKQYKRENRKHPQIFRAPKTWTMLQIWSHVIPASDEKFSITDKICDTHFTDEAVVKYDILPLNDGELVKVERKYGTLKAGAIPTFFPLFPEYSLKVQKIVDKMQKEFPLHIPRMDVQIDEHMENYFKKILELKKKFIPNSIETIHKTDESNPSEKVPGNFKNMITNDTNSSDGESDTESRNMYDENLDTEDRNMRDVDSDEYDRDNDVNSSNAGSEYEDIGVKEAVNVPDEITFDMLVKNLNSVTKPNHSWSITAHGKFVMCAKWNKEYIPEKRVVIDRDLNIKAFLYDSEIATYNNCISDIADISNILCILDK